MPYLSKLKDKFLFRKMNKPGPVKEDHYKIDKVLEFRLEPGTRNLQYKVKWKEYSAGSNQWVQAEVIDNILLQKFWEERNKATLFKKRKGKTDGKGRTRAEMLSIIEKEKKRVLQ